MANKTDTRKTNSRDIVIFAVFLFFSFVLWYLNYLGKDIESDLRTPLKFINPPINKTIAPQSAYLNVTLKGTGYSILKLKYNVKDTVSVDLSKTPYRRAGNTADYYVLTSALAKPYENQTKAGCEITAMKPDTIYFEIKEAD